MAWFHRSRREESEHLERTASGKLAPAPTVEQQKTKLAEAEEFKPAPIAMSTNLPVPVDPQTGKPKPTQNVPATNTQLWAKSDEEPVTGGYTSGDPYALAPKSTPAPAAIPQATSTQSTNKAAPSPKKKTLWASMLEWGKSEDELEEDLAKDAENKQASQAQPQPKKYYDQPEPEAKPELKPTATAEQFKPAPVATTKGQLVPAGQTASKPTASPSTSKKSSSSSSLFSLFKKQEEDAEEEEIQNDTGWANKVEEDKNAEAAKAKETKKSKDAAEAKKAKEAAKDKPVDATKLPQDEKPTFEQYQANPSRYGGAAPGVSSRYKPTPSDLAKQPFQPYKASCSGYGYKAAENCKNCRAMDDWVHCPCGCGSHAPIDRNYDPFAGQSSPTFKGGKPGSTRPW